MEIIVNYLPTPQDRSRALRFGQDKRGWVNAISGWLILLFAMVALLATPDSWRESAFTIPRWLGLGAMGLFAASMILASGPLITFFAARYENLSIPAPGEQTYTFTPEGITIHVADCTLKVPWKHVRRIESDRELVYFILTDPYRLFVPLAKLADAQKSNIQQWHQGSG